MSKDKSYGTVLKMNADKLSVKTYAVEISLPKPGDVIFEGMDKKVTKTKLVMYLKRFMP